MPTLLSAARIQFSLHGYLPYRTQLVCGGPGALGVSWLDWDYGSALLESEGMWKGD